MIKNLPALLTSNVRRLLTAVMVLGALSLSLNLHAAIKDFYRVQEYTQWVKANKEILADVVVAMKADDQLFSIKYNEDSGLSSSAGHGAPAKLYSGKDAKLYESILESQFADMIIKKKAAIGFLVPKKFECGYRHCAVEVFYTQDSPEIDECTDSSLVSEKGKCIFNLENGWYLKYYWRL